MAEQGRTQALKRFMKENEVNVDAVDQVSFFVITCVCVCMCVCLRICIATVAW